MVRGLGGGQVRAAASLMFGPSCREMGRARFPVLHAESGDVADYRAMIEALLPVAALPRPCRADRPGAPAGASPGGTGPDQSSPRPGLVCRDQRRLRGACRPRDLHARDARGSARSLGGDPRWQPPPRVRTADRPRRGEEGHRRAVGAPSVARPRCRSPGQAEAGTRSGAPAGRPGGSAGTRVPAVRAHGERGERQGPRAVPRRRLRAQGRLHLLGAAQQMRRPGTRRARCNRKSPARRHPA